ncbi:hypothetical protein BD289DRAFT_199825 [Coniella lustricola]|uniref:Uncharacterized protein n=1 Tax=Coniella lustricola TaxID=2025994 RepID=A0A2T2ZSL7_9PEZI|nr:hypothetical protein BD289DRAFT_199825 [Coniella lustricola]
MWQLQKGLVDSWMDSFRVRNVLWQTRASRASKQNECVWCHLSLVVCRWHRVSEALRPFHLGVSCALEIWQSGLLGVWRGWPSAHSPVVVGLASGSRLESSSLENEIGHLSAKRYQASSVKQQISRGSRQSISQSASLRDRSRTWLWLLSGCQLHDNKTRRASGDGSTGQCKWLGWQQECISLEIGR